MRTIERNAPRSVHAPRAHALVLNVATRVSLAILIPCHWISSLFKHRRIPGFAIYFVLLPMKTARRQILNYWTLFNAPLTPSRTVHLKTYPTIRLISDPIDRP
jgi:hypothetical protein